MKFSLFIDKSREEEVVAYAHEESSFTESLKRICQENGFELIGIKNRESVRLELSEIHCFVVEDNKIFALTDKEKFQLKCRLYQLESELNENFIKINQSCIANIRKIHRFDASLSGTLTVKFKNGYVDYVSRRNMKNVKERLGL